jgi:WD40 repeat protein
VDRAGNRIRRARILAAIAAEASFFLLLCLQGLRAEPVVKLEVGFHNAPISSLAADSAERYLVTASLDRTVRVWDRSSLRQLRVIYFPAAGLNGAKAFTAAITPDGSTIAAGGSDLHSIYILDRASGNLVRRIADLREPVFELHYSPDGRFLAATLDSDRGVEFYRTSDYRLMGDDNSYADAATTVAFSPKDALLATGSLDGYVRLYRVASDGRLQLLRKRKPDQKDPPVALAFSPDGQKLAVSLDYRDGYPEVEVWNPRTLATLYRAIQTNAMGGTADSIAWSADARFLYLAGDLSAGSPTSLVVRIGKRSDREFETVRACGEETDCSITSLLPLRDGSVLFSSANQHGIGVLNSKWTLERFEAAPVPVFGGLEDYNRFLISKDGRTVRFSYQQDGKQPVWFSIPGRVLAAGSEAAGFEGNPPEERNTRGLGTNEVRVNDVALNIESETGMRVAGVPGSPEFVAATEWSLFLFGADSKRVWRTDLPANPEAINVSGDGKFIVAALTDGTIRWFRRADGKELLALFAHPDGARWVLWTPDGLYDASVGGEDLFGFLTSQGEDRLPEFHPARESRSRFYNPEAVSRALR